MCHGERFPIAALETRLGGPNTDEIARVLHVCSRTVRRYRKHGLSALQADRAAVAAGYHPAEVWTNWW